jgi:hypothetical protein
LGVGFVVAAVLVILTAGTPAAGLPFVIAVALLGKGIYELQQQSRAIPAPVSKERELLAAIRANGGSISPAEAAMETSLTVRAPARHRGVVYLHFCWEVLLTASRILRSLHGLFQCVSDLLGQLSEGIQRLGVA